MSIIYRASRNISFKFPGELISRALAVIFIIYMAMARKLGDDDFGKYSFLPIPLLSFLPYLSIWDLIP